MTPRSAGTGGPLRCLVPEVHGMNELAYDQNDDNDTEDFRTIPRRINGGTVGLKERMLFWEKAKTLLMG